MTRASLSRALLLAAVASIVGPAVAHAKSYAGRPLTEALASLQQQGLAVIYSSDLVRPEMRVTAEPKGRTPREVLDALLAEHGLAATAGPGETLLVVRAPARRSADTRATPEPAPEATGPEEPARFEETVEVHEEGGRKESLSPSLHVQPAEVMAVAGAAENVFRVVQTFPGVTGVNELEGRICVRGGGPDQNLTVMDGIEVHNPYRLFGIASAFNPETIESFELVTGAFHPRYGDRLSSILVVDTRAGRSEKAFAGSGALSLTDSNVVLEGRLPVLHDASWLLTGRRTYYDLVVGSLAEDAQLPNFDDLQLKTSWQPRPGSRLSVLALRSHESSQLARGEETEFKTRLRGDLVSARFFTGLGDRGSLDSVLSRYTNSDTLGFRDDYHAEAVGEPDPFSQSLLVGRDVQIRDLSLREEWGYRISPRHRIGAGFDVHRIELGVAWRLASEVSQGTAISPWMRPDGVGPLASAPTPSRSRGGFWIGDHFRVSDRLSLEGGLRLERGGVTPETTFSPRLSARLRLGEATTVQAAVGLHAQTTGFEKFLQRDLIFDPVSMFDLTHLGAGGLRSERALHAVASLERSLAPGLQLRVEAYYKRFSDLVVGTLETDAERDARLARYDFPAELRASIPTENRLTRFPGNAGTGRAYGFELLLSRKPVAADSTLSGWISYSLGKSDREAYGVRYPFDYDRRHSLNVVGTYRPFSFFELSATARFASGAPWTPARRTRTSATPDVDDVDGDGNRGELVPRRSFGGRPDEELDYGGLANRNSARMPSYGRVDMRVSFFPHGRKGRWTFYLDVINATNRDNPLFMFSTLGVPGEVHNEPTGRLPRVPSLGIRFRF